MAIATERSRMAVVTSLRDRSAKLHGFARGGHGFGMVPQGMPSDRWTDLFLAWLDDLGAH
jgi:hypothetical protein